jgi:hypothetical protein
MTKNHFQETNRLLHQSTDGNALGIAFIMLVNSTEDLLFDGKNTIQPLKWYQAKRLYNLAKICIELITLIYPYFQQIIKLLKK